MNPLFSQFSSDDVRDLIAQYPLAWVVSLAEPEAEPSLLPMFGRYDGDGKLTSLVGHMAKSNPLNRTFAEDGSALFLFCGPQGYVSPSHANSAEWAPTWNYASLRIRTQVKLDEEITSIALEELIERCEAGNPIPWSVESLGDRYAGMRKAIIGFEAKVVSISGVFKLAQDEEAETFRHLVRNHPDAALREWMLRFKISLAS